MTFVNEQGLGIHVKTMHSTANMYKGMRLRRMLGKGDGGRILPWEHAGPGHCWRVTFDHTTGGASFVLQPKRYKDVDLESDGFTVAAKATRGAIKRNRYTFRFKAHAVNQLRILEEQRAELWKSELVTPQQYLEAHLKIDHSLLSKWAKDEDKIVSTVAVKVKKELLATGHPKRWFPEAGRELYKLFMARRKRRLKVSTLWLTVTYRKLLQKMYPDDARAAAFRPSYRWMQRCANGQKLSKRRRSNSKNKSVEERLPKIQRFHRGFRKLLKEPVRRKGHVLPETEPMGAAAAGELRLAKYGQFQLWERFNVDQVPLPFVNGQVDTWEKRGEKRVAIAQPFAGLEKRQCTMQVIFGPAQKLMRVSVIFRGKGKRISPLEKAAYHKNVDVFYQENAWADQKFCMEWAAGSYRKSLMRGRSQLPRERSILLMDNLHAQTTDEFKEYLAKHCNTLAWFFPANNTDEVQPVDAGLGRFLKCEVGKQLDQWLEQSDNLEKWETNALTASDRRVLITQWVGAAMDKVDNRPEYRFRLFEKCGMAMTVDGSGDENINLEGVDKPYSFMDAAESDNEGGGSGSGSDGCGDQEDTSIGGGDIDPSGGGEGDNSGEDDDPTADSEDMSSGGGETGSGGGGQGDNSGEGDDSTDDSDDGKFYFSPA